jgi:hypothetical protein
MENREDGDGEEAEDMTVQASGETTVWPNKLIGALGPALSTSREISLWRSESGPGSTATGQLRSLNSSLRSGC